MGQTNTRRQPSPIGEWRDSLRPKTQEWDVRATRERSNVLKGRTAREKKIYKKNKTAGKWLGWHPGPRDTTQRDLFF